MSHEQQVGIERLHIYGGSCYIDQRALAAARNVDPARVVDDYMIERRSLNPSFEDVITNAVNAARPLLSVVDAQDIGLLIVGTESAVDYGKPISTNIHEALQLPTNVRNFETKHACYSGNAALQTAATWILSGTHRGRKALVISSDSSRTHLNDKEEFVLGGVAAAAIVSDTPHILRLEMEKQGVWTTNAYDTYRPTARDEIGNNTLSLYTYIDALVESYEEYCRIVPDVEFSSYFYAHVFHMPFPAMAMQAHRTLYNLRQLNPKQEVRADFKRRVLPSLAISRLVGSTYGASNFVGLAGLLLDSREIPAGARIGLFTYGSGAIGEMYSGIVGPHAQEEVRKMGIEAQLASRTEIAIEEYERIERMREQLVDAREYTIDLDTQGELYRTQYEGQGKYVLTGVRNFQREYIWS